MPSYLLPAEYVEEYEIAYHGRVPEEEEVSIPENPIPKVERPIPKQRKLKQELVPQDHQLLGNKETVVEYAQFLGRQCKKIDASLLSA